jgi:hypothetical protein
MYVPYQMWHEADPRQIQPIFSSLNNYRHELLVANILGTPVLQQHGQDDDNVPAYHSRRMHQLVDEAGGTTAYHEISGKGHWWSGAMTHGGLPQFLTHFLNEKPIISNLLNKFSIIVANPADTGPRGSISVDQLEEPDKIGRMDVEINGDTWVLTTSNIRRWHFDNPREYESQPPRRIIVDGYQIMRKDTANPSITYLLSNIGGWQEIEDVNWKGIEKNGCQSGPLDFFLNSAGKFHVVVPMRSEEYRQNLAYEILRNLYQYFCGRC